MMKFVLLLLVFAIANATTHIEVGTLPVVSWTNFDDDGWDELTPQIETEEVKLTFAYSCEINMVFVLAQSNTTKTFVRGAGKQWMQLGDDTFVVESGAVDDEHFRYRGDVAWEAMFQIAPHQTLSYNDVHVELSEGTEETLNNIKFSTECAAIVKGSVWLDCNRNGVFDLQEDPVTANTGPGEAEVWVYLCQTKPAVPGSSDATVVLLGQEEVVSQSGAYEFHVALDNPVLHIELHPNSVQSCTLNGNQPDYNSVFDQDWKMHENLESLGTPFYLASGVERNYGFFLVQPQLMCPPNDDLEIENGEQCLMPYEDEPDFSLDTKGCGTFKASYDGDWPPSLSIGTNTINFKVDQNSVVPNGATCTMDIRVLDNCVPDLDCPVIKSCCSDFNHDYRTLALSPPKVYHAAQAAVLPAEIIDTSGDATTTPDEYTFVVANDHYVTWEVTNGNGISKQCTTWFNVTDCEDPVCDVSKIAVDPAPPIKFFVGKNITWTTAGDFLFDNVDDPPPAASWSIVTADGATVVAKELLDDPKIVWDSPSEEDTYILRFDVDDAAGNTGSCELPFVVFDNSPPSCPESEDFKNACKINCSGSSFCTDPGSHLRSLNILAPDVLGTVQVASDAPEEFPIGLTVIQWKLMNEHGFVKTCTEDINVVDCEPPKCGDIVGCTSFCGVGTIGKREEEAVFVLNPTDNSGGKVTVDGPFFDDDHDAGDPFGYGSHDAYFTIEDPNGQDATCPFSFDVKDCTDPWCVPKLDSGHEFCVDSFDVNPDYFTKWKIDLEKPDLHDFETDLDAASSLTAEIVKWNEDEENWGSAILPFPEYLSVGKYKMKWTVEDQASNKGRCEFEFDVVDCQPPHCESFSVTVCDGENEDTAEMCDGKFNLNLYTYIQSNGNVGDNLDSDPSVTIVDVQMPYDFEVSTTAQTVHYVVEDSAENEKTCSITVNVGDCCNPKCEPSAIAEGFLVQFGDSDGVTEDEGITNYCDKNPDQHQRTFSWVYPQNFFSDNGQIVEVWSVVTTPEGPPTTLKDEPAVFTFPLGKSTVEFYAKDEFGNEIDAGNHCPVELYISDCSQASCTNLDFCRQPGVDCCNDADVGFKDIPVNDLHPTAQDGYPMSDLVYTSDYLSEECGNDDDGPCHWTDTTTNEEFYRLPINRIDDADFHEIFWNITDPDGNVNVEECYTTVKVDDCDKPKCPDPLNYAFCIAKNSIKDDFSIAAPECTDNRVADDEIKMKLTISRDGSPVFSETRTKALWNGFERELEFTDVDESVRYTFAWVVGDADYEDTTEKTVPNVLVKDCFAPICSIVHTQEACAVDAGSGAYDHLVTDVSVDWKNGAPQQGDVYVVREEGEVDVHYHCADANAEYPSEIETEVEHCYKNIDPGSSSPPGSNSCSWSPWTPGTALELGWHAWRVRANDTEAFEDDGEFTQALGWSDWAYSTLWTEVVDCTGPVDCTVVIPSKCAHTTDTVPPSPHKYLWDRAEIGWSVTNCADYSPFETGPPYKVIVTLASDDTHIVTEADLFYFGPHDFKVTVEDRLGNSEEYYPSTFDVFDCAAPHCDFTIPDECADTPPLPSVPTTLTVFLKDHINCYDASGISTYSPEPCDGSGKDLVENENDFGIATHCVEFNVTQTAGNEPPPNFVPPAGWGPIEASTVVSDWFEVLDCTGPQHCQFNIPPKCADAGDGDVAPHKWYKTTIEWTREDVSECQDETAAVIWEVFDENGEEVINGMTSFQIGENYVTFVMTDGVGPGGNNTQDYENVMFQVYDCVDPYCTLAIDGACADKIDYTLEPRPSGDFNTSLEMTLAKPQCDDYLLSDMWTFLPARDCSDLTPLEDGLYTIGSHCVEYEVDTTSNPNLPPLSFALPEDFPELKRTFTLNDTFEVEDCEAPRCEYTDNCLCDSCAQYKYIGPAVPFSTCQHDPSNGCNFVDVLDPIDESSFLEAKYGYQTQAVGPVEYISYCEDFQYWLAFVTNDPDFSFDVQRWLEVENDQGEYVKVTEAMELGFCYHQDDATGVELCHFIKPGVPYLPNTQLHLMLKVGKYRVGMRIGDGVGNSVVVPPEGCMEFTVHDCINPVCEPKEATYSHKLEFDETYHVVDPVNWWNWTTGDNYDEEVTESWKLDDDDTVTLEQLELWRFIPGTYTVEMTVEDDGRVPLADPLPAQSGTCSATIEITARNGTVRGTVWMDLNQNQAIDEDEVGIKDVAVQLKYLGDLVHTTYTDDDGNYEFFELLTPCTQYTVELPNDVLDDKGVVLRQTNPNFVKATEWGAFGTEITTDQIKANHTKECYFYGTPSVDQTKSLLPGEVREHFDFGFDRCHLKCENPEFDLKCVANGANCTTCSALEECAIEEVIVGSVKDVVRQLMRKR